MSSILNFLYPPACRHCKTPLDRHAILCNACQSLLEPLPLEETTCLGYRIIPCFEPIGPIQTLIYSAHEPGIQKLLVALMVAHFCRLDLPAPDCLYHARGIHLARPMKKLLSLPIKKHNLTDRVVLVPSLRPLEKRAKRRLMHTFPKTILNLSLVSD